VKSLRNIQIKALLAIEEPNWESLYRHICREFSKEFHVPLFEVINDIPEEEILTHYYENLFSKLYNNPNPEAKDQWEKIREKIIKGDDVLADEEIQKEEEDDAWADEIANEIKKADQAQNAQENPNIINEEIDISIPGEDDFPPKF